MIKLMRNLSLGLSGLCLVTAIGCAHKDKPAERSDVSVTDEARSQPADKTTSPAPARVGADTDKTVNSAKRTDEAARRNREAVANKSAAGAPAEGSDAEYAADVDAAMGDTPAPTERVIEARVVSPVPAGTEADNSKVNRVNDGDVGVTADQQGNSKSDIEITRKIRRTITENKDLSTYAHNVKIITRDGRVVLKGPVRSEAERKVIEDTAVTVAGAGNVTSGLEVQAK